MTSLDDLDLMDATTPATPTGAKRRCGHPKSSRRFVIIEDSVTLGRPREECGRCGHHFDPDRQRAGRNAQQRGKRHERVEMRRAGIHTGNANKADDGLSVDGLFAFQAKSRASATFPGWMALELDKLRGAHGSRTPVLVVIEAAGQGVMGRKLAVVEWSDWLELHGPVREEGQDR